MGCTVLVIRGTRAEQYIISFDSLLYDKRYWDIIKMLQSKFGDMYLFLFISY